MPLQYTAKKDASLSSTDANFLKTAEQVMAKAVDEPEAKKKKNASAELDAQVEASSRLNSPRSSPVGSWKTPQTDGGDYSPSPERQSSRARSLFKWQDKQTSLSSRGCSIERYSKIALRLQNFPLDDDAEMVDDQVVVLTTEYKLQ